MSEPGTMGLVFASLFMLFAVVVFLLLLDDENNSSKDRKGLSTMLFVAMCLAGFFVGLCFYNAGQTNKTLPDLKARGCEGTKTLNYPLGTDYHSELSKLEKSQHNTHCKETITVLYPGNAPKVIALK